MDDFYVDDVLAFSWNVEEYLHRMWRALELLHENL